MHTLTKKTSSGRIIVAAGVTKDVTICDVVDSVENVEILEMNYQEIGWLIINLYSSLQKTINSSLRSSVCGFVYEVLVDTRDFHQRYTDLERAKIGQSVVSAVAWLQSEGFITPMPQRWLPDEKRLVYILTDKAREIVTYESLPRYRLIRQLPSETLHPALRTNAWTKYIRGEFDDSVAVAFKQFEIILRLKIGENLDGSQLITRAFNKRDGVLNLETVEAERQSLFFLAMGSFGYFRNPTSHRIVNMSAEEAAEAIHLANYLIRLTENTKT